MSLRNQMPEQPLSNNQPWSNNFSGKIVQEVNGGKISISLKNGKKEGITRFVSNSGTLLSEINYKNDLIDGEVRQYYPTGQILTVIEYSKGVQHGMMTSYFENGMKQVEIQYEKGEQHGSFKAFDEFGDIMTECTYVKGKKHGKSVTYYAKSQGGGVYELSFYENGLLSGDKVCFYATGEVLSITPYLEGKPQTYTKNYSKDGKELNIY